MIRTGRLITVWLLALSACVEDPVFVNAGGGGGAGGGGTTIATTTASTATATTSVSVSSTSTGIDPLCGNGTIDAGEECDAGGRPDDFCSESCQVVCDCPTCFLIPDSYVCYTYFADLLIQGEAAEVCSDPCLDCGLAMVQTEAQRVAMSVELFAMGVTDVDRIWIGATRVAEGDLNFVWRDQTPLPGDSDLFFEKNVCPHEPTNFAGENGVVFWDCPTDGVQSRWLADDGAGIPLPYLCERPPAGSR